MNAFYWFAIIVGALKLIEIVGNWAWQRAVERLVMNYSEVSLLRRK